MTEYSVEEVRAMASDLRGAPGTSMIGTHISLPTARAVAIYEALCAYAERIAADEGAVPVAVRYFDGKNLDGSQHYAVYSLDRHQPNHGAEPLFLHPPAQAAQVDKPPRLGGCCCGEPCTLGVVHRTDGPCFRYADPAAHPTTNSPEIDSKLVGGAVAQVRHFDYRGVAGHGFSQEAQMLDGAPVLPDGTLLYTAPPTQPAERVVEGKLVGYVWPGKADYDYIHRCMGKDGDPEARRIPGGAVGVYAPLTAAQQADR